MPPDQPHLPGGRQRRRRWLLVATLAASETTSYGVLAYAFTGQALAVPILVLADGTAGVVAFVILFGLGVGLISLVRATLVADFYGLAAYASINGLLALPLTIARAAAPVAAAGLRTATGNYRLVMAGVAVCSVAASLAMFQAHQLARYQRLSSVRQRS